MVSTMDADETTKTDGTIEGERACTDLAAPAGTTLANDVATARDYANAAAADNTMRAYRADWEHYQAWCGERGVNPIPAEPAMVAAYLASMAGTHAATTIRRRLSALGRAHRFAGERWNAQDATVRETLAGIMRTHGRPPERAAALSVENLRRIAATCDDGAAGRRDRALLLLGFAGALRRTEICDLRIADVGRTPGGIALEIRRSKGDRERQGAVVGIPAGKNPETCPVTACDAWLDLVDQPTGPLFRRVHRSGMIGNEPLSDKSVGRILRRRCLMAGIDRETVERLSAHSLRAGFVTAAYAAAVRDEDIMAHSRHRDLRTMRGYVRRTTAVRDSPAGRIGL